MTVHESSPVVVVVSNGPVGPGQIPGPAPTRVIRISTPCLVSAELTGSDFDISPGGPRQQGFANSSTLRWQWSVTPLKSGSSLELDLTIYPVLVLKGIATNGASTDFVKVITVAAQPRSAPDRIWDFVTNPIFLTIVSLIGGLLTAWFGVWLARRGERASTSATPVKKDRVRKPKRRH
jgi:hypothetical protein